MHSKLRTPARPHFNFRRVETVVLRAARPSTLGGQASPVLSSGHRDDTRYGAGSEQEARQLHNSLQSSLNCSSVDGYRS